MKNNLRGPNLFLQEHLHDVRRRWFDLRGLSKLRRVWVRDILPGLTGRQPSKIKPEYAPEESSLGDALSERARDRIRLIALSLACPVADPVGDPEGTRREYNRRELGRREPLAMRLPLGYRLSENSYPGSRKKLTLARLRRASVKFLGYVHS